MSPGIPAVVNDVLLPSYDWLQWVLTFAELGVGALLIVGLVSHGAPLIGLVKQVFLQLLYLSGGRWMFEQPHEGVPLLLARLSRPIAAGLLLTLRTDAARRSDDDGAPGVRPRPSRRARDDHCAGAGVA